MPQCTSRLKRTRLALSPTAAPETSTGGGPVPEPRETEREREILNSPNNPESETLNRLLKHAELRERKPPVGAHSTVLEMRRALRSLAAMGIPEQLRAVQDKAPFSPFRVWGLVFRGLGVYSLGG